MNIYYGKINGWSQGTNNNDFLLKSPLRDALCQVPNQISNVFLAIDFGMTWIKATWWEPHMNNSSSKLWERTVWIQTKKKKWEPFSLSLFFSPQPLPWSLCLSLSLCLLPSLSLFLVTAHLPSHFSLPFILTHYSLPFPLSFLLFFPFPRAPLGESSHLEITKSKTVLRRYGSNDYSKHLLWWTVMWHLKCLYCLSHKFGGQLFQPNQHYS